MSIEIIPAIMPSKFYDIEETAGLVRGHADMVQLDLMDGKYVPEKTWPFFYTSDYDIAALKKEDLAFPFWEEINYELDLMCERPEASLDTWLGIGASRVIFHYASVHDWEKIKKIDHVTRDFIEIGCAITLHDNLDDIYPLIDEGVFDFIQVMGISHIGYMGEPFAEESLVIIDTLRVKYPDLIISVDGAVSEDTIEEFYNAGASRFVSGSSVFGGGDAGENIYHLQDYIGDVTE